MIIKKYSVDEIVSNLFNNFKELGLLYKVVYIDNNHNKLVYDNGKSYLFIELLNNYFYYYDNQFIIGTDIKQHNNINGLLTISYNSTYTNIARATFRLRKLGSSYKINYILQVNINLDTIEKQNYNKFSNNIKSLTNKLIIDKILKYLKQNEILQLNKKNTNNY